ncbi:hypothetical protein ACEUCK_16105, partial [Aeromonas veronii]
EPAGMTTIGLSYSLVKISTKCAPALHATGTTTDTPSHSAWLWFQSHSSSQLPSQKQPIINNITVIHFDLDGQLA